VDPLSPVAVALPLAVAAVLSAVTTVLPRRATDLIAVATAGGVAAVCALLLARTSDTVVHWFGGWAPRHDVAVGISFVVDPIGAGLALLASVLVVASLLFTWRSFTTVGTLFHVLILVFLGALVGFALTGDLFNLFVFFELMGVAAYALTGYRIEERAPLQGALNFAVTNSVGGFLILLGIALVYARTGALNMAQAGQTLAGSPADGLVVGAFLLLLAGFLVKAAVVPFHFWLADAHAVAPTPVCVLFSGVMVQLGLYGAARVYWTVFSGVQGLGVESVLVAAGAVTGVLGAVMCFSQLHLKRMLAFSTLSHSGLFLIGIGLLEPEAMGGVALSVLGHGLAKGALFLATGIVLHRLASIDEDDLRGRGRRLIGPATVYVLGGLALAGLPLFGTGAGDGIVDHAAAEAGFGWVSAVFVASGALTGGAVLRAGGRVFAGWGMEEEGETPAEIEAKREGRETLGPYSRTPLSMALPALVLVAGSLAVGLLPGLPEDIGTAAARLQDREGYVAVVLEGRAAQTPAPGPEPMSDVATGILSSVGAVAVAGFALLRHRLPARLRRTARPVAQAPVGVLRTVHSGHVGDYVAWLVFGVAVLGGALALVTG
jgi:multicomponent Na+:H+ antiporter subunit D